jgi:hypothetical protein
MDYEKQGSDFLVKHRMAMAVKFLRHDRYFPDDTESRDIFRITLVRGVKKYPITFGQSIANSTGDGSHLPTAYDLLACVTKSDSGSFEDWCSEFGNDSDSRKAERLWNLVTKDWRAVQAFFTEDELSELQEITAMKVKVTMEADIGDLPQYRGQAGQLNIRDLLKEMQFSVLDKLLRTYEEQPGPHASEIRAILNEEKTLSERLLATLKIEAQS